jgi:hypothetical protein
LLGDASISLLAFLFLSLSCTIWTIKRRNRHPIVSNRLMYSLIHIVGKWSFLTHIIWKIILFSVNFRMLFYFGMGSFWGADEGIILLCLLQYIFFSFFLIVALICFWQLRIIHSFRVFDWRILVKFLRIKIKLTFSRSSACVGLHCWPRRYAHMFSTNAIFPHAFSSLIIFGLIQQFFWNHGFYWLSRCVCRRRHQLQNTQQVSLTVFVVFSNSYGHVVCWFAHFTALDPIVSIIYNFEIHKKFKNL